MCHVSCQAMDKEDEIRRELQAGDGRRVECISFFPSFLPHLQVRDAFFSLYFGDTVHTRWKSGIFLTLSRL